MSLCFNNVTVSTKEKEYIDDALFNSGLDADKYCKKSSDLLMDITHSKQVLLTHSCTAALEMAAILIDIQPGDEVIMPSYTFVSTANAFVLRGAVPVFVDVREDTFNIDETHIETAITPKTKAIVPVHYAGVGCEMDVIMDIAKRHNLYVVEDAAQCIGATYKGRPLGSIGHFGALSFHYTKNITSGLGGALLINDQKFINRAKIIWQKGTNREAFLEGQVDKYTWCDVGSSFMMPELSAALLFGQLERLNVIIGERLSIWNRYYCGLKVLEEKGILRLPVIPEVCQHNAHIFYLICEGKEQRRSLMLFLKENGIQCTFHYNPLHFSPKGRQVGRANASLYTAVRSSLRICRLPLSLSLTPKDVDYILTQTLCALQKPAAYESV